MKFLVSIIALALTVTTTNAADYNFIDPGEYYYINDWGSDNRKVVVVRKLGNGNVKVRNLATNEGLLIQASRLLTFKELQAEETVNAVGGTAVGVAILVCLMSPETCNKKSK